MCCWMVVVLALVQGVDLSARAVRAVRRGGRHDRRQRTMRSWPD